MPSTQQSDARASSSSRKIVRERHVRIKEIWEVPEDYEMGDNPWGYARTNRSSIRQVHVSPEVYREMIPGEAKEPSLGSREHDRAEQGYWSRLMKAWKASLKG